MVTNLKPEKQGPALVLSLSVKDRETALELTEAELTAVTGVDSVIGKLKVLYKKDTIDTAYDAFEKFIYFKRRSLLPVDFKNLGLHSKWNKFTHFVIFLFVFFFFFVFSHH